MSNGIEMESGLLGIADQIGSLYERLSAVSSTLERIRSEMQSVWKDEFLGEYLTQYDRGLDKIDSFKVTLDTTESYLRQVYTGYLDIDKKY